MKAAWRWIDRRALELLHDESVAEHGGLAGLRDDGLLESALARPANLAACGSADIAGLAAAYGAGLAKNHAFVDGNQRAAFLAIGLFLVLDGHRLTASQAEATLAVMAVAASQMDEAQLAQWLREDMASRR